jgi:hypothetical protein
MRTKIFITLSFLFCFACSNEKKQTNNNDYPETRIEAGFHKTKWRIKEGDDYLYRDQMVNDILYNDTIRTLSADEVLELLGKPDRTNEGHLYYKITETSLGFWTLNQKTLVIKLSPDDSIEWIKLHE